MNTISNDKEYNTHIALQNFLEEMTKTRKKLGMSQRKLRSLTGITQSDICKLETGKHSNPSIVTLQRIADALGKKLVIDLV